MSICLSHWSALHLHLLARVGAIAPARPSRLSSLEQMDTRLQTVATTSPIEFLGKNRPVDVVVAHRASTYTNRHIKAHLLSAETLAGCLYTYGDFYVVSPELALIQIAPSLEMIDLISFVMELAGSYSTLSGYAAYGLSPLLRLTQLERATRVLKSTRGAKTLARALPYALENSASPMETALTLALTLPVQRGGFGLKPPQLNACVDLNAHAAQLAGKKRCYCDLFWPEAKLALEYDSREFHEESYQHGRDTGRALALQAMGITVQEVTYLQMVNLVQLTEIAALVAGHAGKQLHQPSKEFLEKRRTLIRKLTCPAYFVKLDCVKSSCF